MLEESKKMVVDADTRLGKTVADLRDLVVSPLFTRTPLDAFPMVSRYIPRSSQRGTLRSQKMSSYWLPRKLWKRLAFEVVVVTP